MPGISGHFGTPGSHGEIGELVLLSEPSLYSLPIKCSALSSEES